jgi:DNA-binding Lrp family transcriptional regulator
VVVPDPVDARLLNLLADLGRSTVHDIAARLGMDPREVAWRLVGLGMSGLPIVVGAECEPNTIRAALGYHPQGPGYGTPSGVYQVQGTPSGAYPAPGTPAGGYPGQPPYPPQGPQSAPHGYPQAPPRTGSPSQPFPAQPGPQSGPFPVPSGPPSGPQPAQPTEPAANPAISTWGPPQSSSWARGDQPTVSSLSDDGPTVHTTRPAGTQARTGTVGGALEVDGPAGERLSITLVEVVDPADYLFTAAGYQLQPGERAVVVHTELTNRGTVSFSSLPDQYLVLVAEDGTTVGKAPVSLSSRPPHRIGVAPGETAGGHTVYVLADTIDVRAVRWRPGPDDEARTLTWTVDP